MSIQTADCVKAILKYFYDKDEDNLELLRSKSWKRLSKKGTGDNILRVFEHKETGKLVYVYSTETQIRKIVESPPKITSIKGILREKLKEFDFYDLTYEMFGENNIVNWPQIKMKDFIDDPDNEEFEEPLDMENFEWLSVTDDELVVACGGDWQEPLTLTIRLVDGKLTVINTVSGFDEGLTEEEFIKLISE